MATNPDQPEDCECLKGNFYYTKFERRDLGMDDDYGEASIHRCKNCGRYWLHYLMEYEYLTAAGRWFRGLVTPDVAASVDAQSTKRALEDLEWYYRGGSAFGGEIAKVKAGQLKYWLMPFPGPSSSPK